MFRCNRLQRITQHAKACPYAMALSFWKIDTQANQRDGSFGLYMPKAYQKNRPFGLKQELESSMPHHQRRPLTRSAVSSKYCISIIWRGREVSRPYHSKSFSGFGTRPLIFLPLCLCGCRCLGGGRRWWWRFASRCGHQWCKHWCRRLFRLRKCRSHRLPILP